MNEATLKAGGTIIGVLLVVGAIFKHAFPKFPNRFIPLLTLVLGVPLFVVQTGDTSANGWLTALLVAATATGTHSTVKNLMLGSSNTAAIILALLLPLGLLGCKSSPQTVAYKSLYSVETSVNAAHDSYLDLVVRGAVKTNDVPQVARAYDRFQAGMQGALSAAQFNYTNPAPAAVAQLATDVLNAILKAKGQ